MQCFVVCSVLIFEATDFNDSSDRQLACVLGTVSDRDAFEEIYYPIQVCKRIFAKNLREFGFFWKVLEFIHTHPYTV